MVMQVVTEVLYMADGGFRDYGIDEVPREQNEGDIANIIRLNEIGYMRKLKGRVPGGIQNLWSALNRG